MFPGQEGEEKVGVHNREKEGWGSSVASTCLAYEAVGTGPSTTENKETTSSSTTTKTKSPKREILA